MKPKTIIEKNHLHPRNLHRLGYDFAKLILANPELQSFVFINNYQTETIDFSNSEAVKALNKTLLLAYYDIEYWDIPAVNLCPPIPGRADYIHYLADLLASNNNGIIPTSETIQGLDIGVGTNCIYPLLGNSIYGWSFVGTDTDENALQNCKKILSRNPKIADAISLQYHYVRRSICVYDVQSTFSYFCN
jgi:23S rRNA (adenine1618-N6)-methyltransferase